MYLSSKLLVHLCYRQILLVSGRRTSAGTLSPYTYVLDTETGTYTTRNTLYGSGFREMGCGIKPSDANVIMCVGGVYPGVWVKT